ncbi:AAA family ATPase [Ferruginibacter sp.]|nr:MoxR family ATPase [Ferruginibacter sp.]
MEIQILRSLTDEYKPSAQLLAAINTALFLQRPLLLSGDPGTGKTECANFVARQLNLLYPYTFLSKKALRFDTKSGSQSSDLFYSYDAVSHFGDKTNRPKESFISFNSFGLALLGTNLFDANLKRFMNYEKEIFNKNSCFGSVVLIDEIDKAPRDLPNDLLAELEKPPFKFSIKELPDFTIEQDPRFPVFTIITSNNEKGLPDAFLRRCVFHHISFPDSSELLQIVKSNLKTNNEHFETVIDRFTELRQKNLVKRPATSELIDWIACLQQKKLLNSNMANWRGADEEYKAKLIETLGIITKSQADFETVRKEIIG